jgi:hypothetical protein
MSNSSDQHKNPDEVRKEIVENLFKVIGGYEFQGKAGMTDQLRISFDQGKEGNKKRKAKTLFSPSFLMQYLQQQIEENQSTIDFLRTTYGEATAQKLCGRQAHDIVLQSAILDSLIELQELQKIQARQQHILDARLDSLKTLKEPESTSNTKHES